MRPERHGWKGDEPLTLFDLNSTKDGSWQVVNDRVMGWRSNGAFEIKEGTLHFTGNLVTRGGGFTSLRAARSTSRYMKVSNIAFEVEEECLR